MQRGRGPPRKVRFSRSQAPLQLLTKGGEAGRRGASVSKPVYYVMYCTHKSTTDLLIVRLYDLHCTRTYYGINIQHTHSNLLFMYKITTDHSERI